MRPMPISWRMRAVQLFALWGFGIAQPIYEILKDEPFWPAVQGYDGVDIVLYALALLIVPPIVLVGAEFVLDLASSRAAGFAHAFFIVVLAAFTIGRGLHILHGSYRLVAALAGALFFERLLKTWYPMRLFVSICALGPVFFVAFYMQGAHIADLSKEDAALAAPQAIKANTPVVVVIFDEFPLSSLLTPSRQVDSVRYPNFAALASTTTWYRNATTVHDYTFWAVPAILDGRRPTVEELPVLADHPQNLFTLLSGSGYQVHAFQPVTRLCPASVCVRAHSTLVKRMRDAGVHVERSLRSFLFLTGSYHAELPDWKDPTAQISRFLNTLQPRAGRQLYVLHVLLPHDPWRFLPSGRSYHSPLIGIVHGRWTSQARYVDRGYQRHLLQVGYVDRILGEIVRRLRVSRLWNRSLLVVTADHGVSFHPGDERRTVDARNVSDIAFVPLFVKEPEQRVGRVDDRAARTIDVLPTIADTLGLVIPWHVDGRSLLAADRPLHPGVVVNSALGPPIQASWMTLAHERADTIARKAALFGVGADPRLVSLAPASEISLHASR
jgi:Sulfatase